MRNSRYVSGKRTRRQEPAADLRSLMRFSLVKPVARRNLTIGTVCQARVPFSDGTGDKVRPVVVVTATQHEVRVLPMTTSLKAAHREPHLAVSELDEAGLTRRSWIRLHPTVIERRYVNQIIGRLGDEDHMRVFIPEQEAA